jgi:hypothetical protein
MTPPGDDQWDDLESVFGKDFRDAAFSAARQLDKAMREHAKLRPWHRAWWRPMAVEVEAYSLDSLFELSVPAEPTIEILYWHKHWRWWKERWRWMRRRTNA